MKVVSIELRIKGIPVAIQNQEQLSRATRLLNKQLKETAVSSNSYNIVNAQLGKAIAFQKALSNQTNIAQKAAEAQGQAGVGAYQSLTSEIQLLESQVKNLRAEQARGGIIDQDSLSRAEQELGKLKSAQQEIRDEIKLTRVAAEAQGESGVSAYKMLTSQISLLQNTVRNLKAEQAQGGIVDVDELKKAEEELGRLKASQQAFRDEALLSQRAAEAQGKSGVGAYRQLASRVLILQRRVKDLKAEQAKGAIIDVNELEESNEELQRALNLLRSIDNETGDFRRNVGNYQDAIEQALNGQGTLFGNLRQSFGRFLKVGAIIGGVTLAAQGVQAAVADAAKTVREFNTAQAQLSSITGLSGDSLDELSQKAIDISVRFGTATTDILEGFQLVGSAAPQLLDDADALAEVTLQAEILSKAAGLTLPEAVEAVTKSLNQFGLDASEAASVVDILATSQQRGTATIDKLSESLKNVGSVANSFGFDIEKTNVLLQALAKGGLDGAEAGTQLRGVLLRLAKTGREDLNPATQDFNDILKTLQDELVDSETGIKDVTAAQEIFGAENASAALTLIDQSSVVEELSGNLNELGNGLSQASTNTDTLDGAINRLTSEWRGLVLSVEDGSGVLSRLFTGLTESISGVLGTLRLLNDGAIDSGSDLFVSLFGSAEDRQNIIDSYNAIQEKQGEIANPTRAQRGSGLGGLVDSLKKATEASEDAREDVQKTANSLKALEERKKELEGKIEITDIDSTEFQQLSQELRDTNTQIKSIKESFSDATSSASKSVRALAEGSVAALKKQLQELRTELQGINPQSEEAIEIAVKITNLENEVVNAENLLERLLQPREPLSIIESGSERRIEPVQREIGLLLDKVKELQEIEGIDIEVLENIDSNFENIVDPSQVRDSLRKALLEAGANLDQIDLDLQAQVDLIFNQDEVSKDQTKQFLEEVKEISLANQQEISESNKQRLQEEQNLRRQFIETSLQIASQASTALFDIRSQRIEERAEKEKRAVDDEFDRRIEAAKGNDKEVARLEKLREQRQFEIEKRVAKEKQRLAITEAIIQGAIAVARAGSNPFSIALAVANTALQVATIRSQQFEEGGIVEAKYGQKDGDPVQFVRITDPRRITRSTSPHEVALNPKKYRHSLYYQRGGLAKGPSHAQGGIRGVIRPTGQQVEFEGGEAIINKRSLMYNRTYTFTGTPLEIASKINTIGGHGVHFASQGILMRKQPSPMQKVVAQAGRRLGEQMAFNQIYRAGFTDSQMEQLGDIISSKMADVLPGAIQQAVENGAFRGTSLGTDEAARNIEREEEFNNDGDL